jgi:hypothetical protein
MLGRRASLAVSLLAGAIIGALISGIAAAAELPPGPNRDLVSRACSTCHGVENLFGHDFTREAWEIIVEGMTGYGLDVSPRERGMIVEYLATALGPNPAAAKR